jgi:hypothetical protein
MHASSYVGATLRVYFDLSGRNLMLSECFLLTTRTPATAAICCILVTCYFCNNFVTLF